MKGKREERGGEERGKKQRTAKGERKKNEERKGIAYTCCLTLSLLLLLF
jgi:hypothetical protein